LWIGLPLGTKQIYEGFWALLDFIEDLNNKKKVAAPLTGLLKGKNENEWTPEC
jgi:hypothetical protein